MAKWLSKLSVILSFHKCAGTAAATCKRTQISICHLWWIYAIIIIICCIDINAPSRYFFCFFSISLRKLRPNKYLIESLATHCSPGNWWPHRTLTACFPIQLLSPFVLVWSAYRLATGEIARMSQRLIGSFIGKCSWEYLTGFDIHTDTIQYWPIDVAANHRIRFTNACLCQINFHRMLLERFYTKYIRTQCKINCYYHFIWLEGFLLWTI